VKVHDRVAAGQMPPKNKPRPPATDIAATLRAVHDDLVAAVASVEGVYQATASFKDGRVTVLFDPTTTDRAKLEEALRKKGVDLGKPKP
jgi:hypothetical protein